MIQETTHRKGSQLIHYEINHMQTGRKGRIDHVGSKIIFAYEDENGKKENKTEDYSENLVINFTLVPYIGEHWANLLANKEIKIRLGVWDRQETIGFSIANTNRI